MAEIEEKVFHHFLEFSPKVRMMVINEMEPADRCRLTRCSKLCHEEAKALKNYIHEMVLVYYSNGIMSIDVIHGTHEPTQNTGYSLVFNSEKKLKTYMNQRDETLWETELDNDTDVAQLALKEFKRYVAVRKILSKLRKPLKTLYSMLNSSIIDYKPIYQVQESLTWYGAKFNIEQFLKLSAKRVVISIGNLTEKDIFSFIRSWQNGTIGKDIESCYWTRNNSDFNIHRFLKLLRIRDFDEQRQTLEIKHFEEAGKHASLCISELSIRFVVTQ